MQPGPRLPAPLFADLATVAIECVDVADRLDLLFDAERAVVRDAARKRQSEFASDRHAAHRLMDRLGVGRAPILRAERAPVWPRPPGFSYTPYGTGLLSAPYSNWFHLIEPGSKVKLPEN